MVRTYNCCGKTITVTADDSAAGGKTYYIYCNSCHKQLGSVDSKNGKPNVTNGYAEESPLM